MLGMTLTHHVVLAQVLAFIDATTKVVEVVISSTTTTEAMLEVASIVNDTNKDSGSKGGRGKDNFRLVL